MVYIDSIPLISQSNGLTSLETIFLYSIYNGNIKFKNEIIEELTQASLTKLTKQGYLLSDVPVVHDMSKIRSLFLQYEDNNKNVPVLDNNVYNVDNWIDTYRKLFKGKCFKAVPMGNRQTCIVRMKWFLNKYPDYADIDLIKQATELGLSTITSKYGKDYVPQADNFIVVDEYKTNGGFGAAGKLYKAGKEYLVNYCEMITEGNIVEDNNVGNISF